ncbi:unnamed protein product [Allacma fusca]|uniref:Uncharacterized protein n=1 Tax=Allacma fusca TaxID=39272 RepID=A0A8J2JQ47_9HEXA|nr:unnamed protein product [Allacma fusca]
MLTNLISFLPKKTFRKSSKNILTTSYSIEPNRKLSDKIVMVAQTLMLCLQQLGSCRHIQLALPVQLKLLHSQRTKEVFEFYEIHYMCHIVSPKGINFSRSVKAVNLHMILFHVKRS